MEDPKKASSIYEFTAKDIDGNEVMCGTVNRSPDERLKELVGHGSGADIDLYLGYCSPMDSGQAGEARADLDTRLSATVRLV